MKQSVLTLITLSLFVACQQSFAQRDTVRITAKDINTSVLKEGTHRYLVYFKNSINGPRYRTQFWTRTIGRTPDKNIVITQEWEDADTIAHTVTSVSKIDGMTPVSHTYWWKGRGSVSVDFPSQAVAMNGKAISAADTAKRAKAVWQAFESSKGQYFLNWHLDLETFPTLPFKEGRTFIIPFYDPGVPFPLQKAVYTVTGSDKLQGYDNQLVDCWIMIHEDKGNKEKFWISKKTKEVLKLEQEFTVNGKQNYRYKIKFGFSV